MLCARGIYIYNKVIKWEFAHSFFFGNGVFVWFRWFGLLVVGWVSAVGDRKCQYHGRHGWGLDVGVGVNLASDWL